MSTVRPELLEDADLPVPFGRYTLLDLLGEGGMARVFRAELQGPEGFRKRAAVKIIHATVARKSDKLKRALINEARLGGLLHHPNIVDTYEFGEEQGLPYIAMELVRGVGLDRFLELTRVPPAQALEIAIQICAGLDHAHSLEDDDGNPVMVVHRDLKPSNVLLSRDGLVKVMDFGIAKAATNTHNTTETGMTKGTPAYMSPEQAEGIELDERSDIFALGALLYELCTGERLFRGDSMVQVLMAVLRVETLLQDETRWQWLDAEVPGLRAVVTRCLRKDRDLRYPDCPTLEQDLKQLARSLPPPLPLKTTVRGLMKQHGLGTPDGSSSIRVPGSAAPSGPAERPTAPPGSGSTVAQTRSTVTPSPPGEVSPSAGLRSSPDEPSVVAPTRVQFRVTPPASSTPAGTASQTLPDGTASTEKYGRAPLIALVALLLVAVATAAYLMGARETGSAGESTLEDASSLATAASGSDVILAEIEPASSADPTIPAPPSNVESSVPEEPSTKPATREASSKPTGPGPSAPKDPATSEKPSAKPATSEKPSAKPAIAAKPSAKPAVERPADAKPLIAAAGKPAVETAFAFDPDDPNLVVEHARVRVREKDDGTWRVRFVSRIRGGRGATAVVHFNPPGAGWIRKTMKTSDDVTFSKSVVFQKKNLGKTYWYIDVQRPDGRSAGWGGKNEKKRFEIEK